MNSQTLWLPCGQGILLHPNPELTRRECVTEVVELKGFGRIFEVYHYGNEPEQTQRLIVAAPALLSALQRAADHLLMDATLDPESRTSNDSPEAYAQAAAAISAATGQPEPFPNRFKL